MQKDLFRFSKDWPYHVSAGSVTFRKHDGGHREVALVHRGKERFGEDSWHLPKGTLHNGETIEHAALRETREEAGIEVEIVGYLGAMTQSWRNKQTNILIDKTTHYFLTRYIREADHQMDSEHDDLQWLKIEEAKQKTNLEPKQEDEIIDRALAYIEKFGGLDG